ncbi:hypothetical protein J6590_030912 [Homalodisca vitripennis]|nr:hypothetical protein J6590_030912 [Homalodisca vitripennis]
MVNGLRLLGDRLYPNSPRLARRTPLHQQPAGLSDTPTSDNASDATLTDSTNVCVTGKGGRLYPTYPVSGSDGEDSSPRLARRTPLYQQPAGLSDTPTSDNASDATLTDSELALARDSTLLVHNG